MAAVAGGHGQHGHQRPAPVAAGTRTKITTANGIATSQPRLWPISVTPDSSPAQARNRPRLSGATSRAAARYRHGNVASTHMATLALM